MEAKNNTVARILGWVSLSHTSAFDITFVQLHFDMMTMVPSCPQNEVSTETQKEGWKNFQMNM